MSCNKSNSCCPELLTYLCQLKGYSKPQLLFADEGVLLELVLSRLQGSLHKNNWREKSVAKQALVWLVQQLKVVKSSDPLLICHVIKVIGCMKIM